MSTLENKATRTRRDIAVLAAIDTIGGWDFTDCDSTDEFRVRYLENSGALAVCWTPGIIFGARDLSPLRGLPAWTTKLDSGESIAHTDTGRAYIARLLENEVIA
jgi:hypothetical protein